MGAGMGQPIVASLGPPLVGAMERVVGSLVKGIFRKNRTIVENNPETIMALTNMTNQVNTLNREMEEIKNIYAEQLRILSQTYQKDVEELRFLMDPNQIQKAEEIIFKNFVDNLRSFDAINLLPKAGNMRFVAVVGENSSGKSSILNQVLSLNLEVGVDDTTQEISRVYSDLQRRLVYFDSPGLNQAINITHPQILKAFYSIDIMFIFTAVTFKNSIKTIQVMDKINPPKLFLVRNHCDKFENEEAFQKAVEKDRQLLRSYNIRNVAKVLYVSTFRDDSFLDNAELRRRMRGE